MHPLSCFVFGQEVTLSWRNVTWPLRGRSAACHNYPPGPLTSSFGERKKKGACVSWSSQLGRVSQEEKTPVGRVFISPSAPFAWHGKTARHSSHRRSGSGLRLALSGSLCHSRVADSGPFGSQTWLGCLEEVESWWVWAKEHSCCNPPLQPHTLFQKTLLSPFNSLPFMSSGSGTSPQPRDSLNAGVITVRPARRRLILSSLMWNCCSRHLVSFSLHRQKVTVSKKDTVKTF